METVDLKLKLRSMLWDYEVDYSPEDIYLFLIGEKDIKEFNRNQLIARMLISLRWYDMIDIFGLKRLYGFLNDEVFKYIWKKSLKDRYNNVRETLQRIL